MSRSVYLVAACFALAGCSAAPLVPFSSDGPPLVMMPAAQAGISDGRGRFREIACAVLETHREDQPNYEPCEQALSRVGEEGGATGEPVNLDDSRQNLVAALVPGIGWECFRHWLDWEERFKVEATQFGYRNFIFEVDGLSGTAHNARMIRDEIMARREGLGDRRLVLLGYSKGAPDILEAIVDYPEIRPWVAAVVSVAGSVGGSPLAYDFDEDDLDLLQHVPDSTCSSGDGEGVRSLHPAVRQKWLAENPLPNSIPYYSVVTFPQEDQISDILKGSYRKLAAIDPRNDSQVLFYDQVIPGSTLVTYLNADHWAVAVPVAESHPFIGKHFVDQNAYPWRAIFESILRFVEEDLEKREAGNG
jgi:hypothetical protein